MIMIWLVLQLKTLEIDLYCAPGRRRRVEGEARVGGWKGCLFNVAGLLS